jgi:tRNA(adenine34) deaminase
MREAAYTQRLASHRSTGVVMTAAKAKSLRTKGREKAVTKASVHRSHTRTGSKRKRVNRWSANVHTESTYPERGLFTKDASTIARSLASKKTSPRGPASGMRMLNFYINRAGHNLSASHKKELARAKSILSEIIARKKRAGSD